MNTIQIPYVVKELPLPKSKMIKNIIHISDIHIRIGDIEKSRYDEYAGVFNNLYNTLSVLPTIQNNTAAIVITGDFFETKNRAESPGIKLFNMLISLLSSLAPVYIIQGNHDYRQDQVDSPDMLSSLLYGNHNPNIYYLAESGCYIAGDLGFSLISVKDTLRAGDTSGQIDVLPEFPMLFPPNIKTKIALFHGTVIHSTLQNYTRSPTGYPLEWFKHFDLTLLGDVHLQQIHNVNSDNNNCYHWDNTTNKKPWAYSGSLIQQNFGESIFDHGFLLWNLENSTVIPYHIKNIYGMIHLKFNKNEEWNAFYKTWIPINELLQNPNIPETLLIKIKGETSPDALQSLQVILSNHNIKFKIISTILNNFGPSNNDTDIDPAALINNTTDNTQVSILNNISGYNSPDTWIKYISENLNKVDKDNNNTDVKWDKWIKNPETIVIPLDIVVPSLIDKAKKRNTDIIKLVAKLQDQQNLHLTKIKKPINLLYISWQWILCYKNNNWFNFTNITKKICTINAKNDSGKSSFLEIICLAIFGETIPSRYNKEYSASLICDQKPPHEYPSVKLEFAIDNKTYRIYRILKKKPDNKLEIYLNELSEAVQDSNGNLSFTIIKSGKTAVNAWVSDNIGDIDSFLLSCMITQNSDKDFFSMKKTEQVTLLDKALHLDSINYLSELFNETRNAYKQIIDQTEAIVMHSVNSVIPVDPAIALANTENQLLALKKQYADTQQQINSVKILWSHKHINDLQLDSDSFKNILGLNLQKLYSSLEGLHAIHKILLDYLPNQTDPESLLNIFTSLDFKSLKLTQNTSIQLNTYTQALNSLNDILLQQRGSILANIADIQQNSDDNIAKIQIFDKPIFHSHNLLSNNTTHDTSDDISDENNEFLSIDDVEQFNNDMLISDWNEYNTYLSSNPDNTDVDIEYLQQEAETIHQWFQSNNEYINENTNKANNVPTINDIADCKKLLDDAIMTMNQINQPHNIPGKPTKTIDEYNLWMSQYKQIINEVDTKYGSINQLYVFCLKNKLVQPQYDIKTLNKMHDDLLIEKEQLDDPTWLELSDIDFAIKFDKLEIEYKSHNGDYIQLRTQITTQHAILDSAKNKWDIATLDFKKHKNNLVKQPNYQYTDVCAWIDLYNKDKLVYHIYNNISTLFNQLYLEYKPLFADYTKNKNDLVYLDQQIQSYDNDNHPYNPDCWACQKQQWKIQLDSLQSKKTNTIDLISGQKHSLSDILKKFVQNYNDILNGDDSLGDLITINTSNDDIIDNNLPYGDIYDKVSKWLLSYKQSEIKMTTEWKQLKLNWEKYNAYTTQLDKLENIMQNNQNIWEKENLSLKQLQNKEKNTLQSYEKFKQLYESAMWCKNNRNRWRQTNKIINDQKLLLESYSDLKDAHDSLAKANKYIEALPFWEQQYELITKYNKWTDIYYETEQNISALKHNLTTITDKYNQYQNFLNEHQLWFNKSQDFNKLLKQSKKILNKEITALFFKKRIYHNLLFFIDEKTTHVQESLDIIGTLDYWIKINTYKPSYLLYNQLKEQITTIANDIQNTEIRREKLFIESNNYKLQLTDNTNTRASLTQLKNNKNIIDAIILTFSGFRQWLYDTIVIPRLLQETNNIVHTVTDTNLYKLTATICSNNTFSWFITDGINCPIVEKAGGFRKFIFGLAIRIAISYIGANSISCKQLFIDEGFVSADTDNLERIPDFIRQLLGTYNSVILVSHLDIIKSCGDVNVSILKNNKQLSQIQFGNNPKPNKTNINYPLTDQSDNDISPELLLKDTNNIIDKKPNLVVTIIPNNDKTLSALCIGKLKNGSSCTAKAKNGSQYCRRHLP
jgi:DNA repair exonuclease SbcCD ATPase subunit/DNA repair exonuclease SbcCD nuclease subunit